MEKEKKKKCNLCPIYRKNRDGVCNGKVKGKKRNGNIPARCPIWAENMLKDIDN